MKIVYVIFLFAAAISLYAKEHPSLIISEQEANKIKQSLGQYYLLDKSYNEIKTYIDGILNIEMELPPPGEGGGYAHERHKQNYRDMHMAGMLYSISGIEEYARFVKEMLFKYAEMYPTLGPHPLSKKQAPGKLFHQMLNETVWLVYTSMAYDCIYDWLSEKDRTYIEKNIFKNITDWFTKAHKKEFNRIHNHGTWSVASIGMLGFVIDDQDLVDMALYGTEKDGNGGFLRQLDMLFSPDGYYMEGPYYIRYALRPFFLFAEAIERNRPELKIFEYRDSILKKAYYSAVQTTFPNGIFAPINDASLTMDLKAAGPVISNSIVYNRYGADKQLLAVAKLQDGIFLSIGGLKLATDYSAESQVTEPIWKSVEFTDGHNGQQGGLGIIRYGSAGNQTMLLMKYGVHGEGHGHFDKLHFIYYDQNRQIIPDYGFCRWINIELKDGGRYLPENNTYAKQTIAHNTVTVDQKTQNLANRKEADNVFAKRHFFNVSDKDQQVMSAISDAHYPGVKMQRTMILLNDDRLDYPIVVDLYRLQSQKEHSYDYPLHYTGQLMYTSTDLDTELEKLIPIGNDYGYQHIWKTASEIAEDNYKFTWLAGQRYYSFITDCSEEAKIIHGRTGANDPDFNLRSEPMLLIREKNDNHLFASVIEPHGYFNEAAEKSEGALGIIKSVNVIGFSEQASIVEILGEKNIHWQIYVNNQGADPDKKNRVTFSGKTYEWTGNFKVVRN